MFNYDHFFGVLSAFSPSIINTVKLSKNASDTKYRSHISGVVDIALENEIPKKLEAGAGLNLMFLNAHLKLPIYEKTALIVSARRSFTNLIETKTFDAYSDQIFQNTKFSDQF